MKIGIDVDDVIFEFLNSFLDFYNNKTGKKFLKEQFSSYYFWEITGETREEGVKLVDEFHNSDLFDWLNSIYAGQTGWLLSFMSQGSPSLSYTCCTPFGPEI